MNSGSKVRFAVFASVSDIYRNGIRGQKFVGRGTRTPYNLNKEHCAIVVPDFLAPYRERLERKKDLNLRSVIRDEAALEPEHISRVVIHGSLEDLKMLWALDDVPGGISWVVNQNGVLDDAIRIVSRQESGELFVVMPKAAPQAIGLMIDSWDKEGEIIMPNNRQMDQVYPAPERRSVNPPPRIESRR